MSYISEYIERKFEKEKPLSPSDALGRSAYVVRGYALVPHEVEIWVEAESPRQAMQKAKRIFERGPNRGQWIVSNSEDICAAYDFEPNEAKPPISRQNADVDARRAGARNQNGG